MSTWMGFLFLCLALPGQSATSEEQLVTPWIEPKDRRPLNIMDIGYTNQDGAAGVLGELMNKPVVVAFFYTRCQNAAKCSMTMSRLAALQRTLYAQGLDSKARVLAITYRTSVRHTGQDPPVRNGSGLGVRAERTGSAHRNEEAQGARRCTRGASELQRRVGQHARRRVEPLCQRRAIGSQVPFHRVGELRGRR